MSGLLVVSIQVFYVRLVGLVIREGFFHIGDQHAELGSPISHMVGSDHIMVHVLQHSADGLSNNGASEMANMHFFGDVR